MSASFCVSHDDIVRVVRDSRGNRSAFQLETAHEPDPDVASGAVTLDHDYFQNIADRVGHDFAIHNFW